MTAYQPFGNTLEMFHSRDPELILSGPAGTGKTRGILEKFNLMAIKYAGCRMLMCRKTRASLTQSAMVTFEQHVLPPGWFGKSVRFHTADQEYRYSNGSVFVVGGMDKPTKVMSTEFDAIYVQEAIELTEAEWEALSTRVRNGRIPYQPLVGDTNPDSPRHWIKLRASRGDLRLLPTVHEENPALYDQKKKEWTERGRNYIARLEKLTGVRYKRLRKGLWVSAEGAIYEEWNPDIHHIYPFDIPKEWPRFWAVDFGFTNPFSWGAYTVDPDGRLYLYREIYHTQRQVENHCRTIREITKNDPPPVAIICDHDAEGRATMERHLGCSTVAAYKLVSEGIQAVQSRLKPAGDGKPRLFIFRDALHERDPELVERKLPTCLAEEIDGYIWNTSSNRKKGEEPVKENDHGMDQLRYMVAHRDCNAPAIVIHGPSIYGGSSLPKYDPNQRGKLR